MNDYLFELIKNTGATRHYTNSSIPVNVLEQIAEAGVWGPSVLAVQPWELVVINDALIIKEVSKSVNEFSNKIQEVPRKVVKLTARIIENCAAIILVYNNKKIQKGVKKYGNKYKNHALKAEIQSIGATIQNMILMANSLGVGTAWLDSPTFYSQNIKKVVQNRNELVAIIALGYPDQKIFRSKRRVNVTKSYTQ